MPEHLFISYSHKDYSFMERMKSALQQEGYATWFDRGELDVGNKWRGEIVGAIKAASAFILVLSPSSVESDEVRKELSLAEDFKKSIFPILLGDTKISDALAYHLAGLQYINFKDGKDDIQFQPLIRGLKSAGIKPAFAGETSDTCVPFFGRTKQLALLDSHFRAMLAKNQVGICFVVGDFGSGKTALIDQFLQRCIENDPAVVVAIGCCNSITGMSDPYLPFKQILSALFGDPRDTGGTASFNIKNTSRIRNEQAASTQMLLEYAEDLVGSLISGHEVLRALAGRGQASLALADQLKERLERADAANIVLEQSRIQAQYTKIIRRLAQERPYLLVLRDIEWIDIPSIQLLFHLFRELGKSRVLMIVSYRTVDIARGRDRQPHPVEPVLQDIKRYAGDVWIDLDHFDDNECLAFVDGLIDSEPNLLDGDFRQMLIDHTQGNALFCIELLHSMQEHGDLVRDGEGRWKVVKKLDWDRLPARIEAVVQRRIGGLTEEELQALEVASIEGQMFTAELIARIGEQAERTLIKVLSQLAKRHGMVEASSVERSGQHWLSRYKFLQSHIQKYLYNNLAPREKMFFHGEAGKFLEEVYEGRTDDVALQLAWHFDQAGETAKAIRCLAIAARQALGLSGYDEAKHLLERGLALLENVGPGREHDEMELALRIPQGTVVKVLNGWTSDQIKAIYDRACQLGLALDRKDEIAPAMFGLWAYHLVRLELDEAKHIALECHNLATAIGDDDLLIQASFSLGNTSFWIGEFAEAEGFVRQALGIFNPANAERHLQRHGQDSRVFALMFLSIIGSIQDSEETDARIQSMLALANTLNHPFSFAIALQGAAWTSLNLGRLDKLEQYSSELINLTRKHRFPFYLGVGQLFHGYSMTLSGDHKAGLAEFQEGWEQISAGGSKILHSVYCSLLGQVHLAEGNIIPGLAIIEQGLAVVQTCNERAYEAELHLVNSELLACGPRAFAEVAKSELKIAVEIAEKQGALCFLKKIRQAQSHLQPCG